VTYGTYDNGTTGSQALPASSERAIASETATDRQESGSA
jgi:hypothetical protein